VLYRASEKDFGYIILSIVTFLCGLRVSLILHYRVLKVLSHSYPTLYRFAICQTALVWPVAPEYFTYFQYLYNTKKQNRTVK